MNNDKSTRKGTYFYIAICGVFMLIICHSWLSHGMFMDGTIYATLSRNMAFGSGTFWHAHFTDTLFPAFFEHPPLALGLEAILFRVFGDNRFVERFYSLLTIFLAGMIIVSIWKQTVKKSSTGWLPLLFWISMPTVFWASVNNMLESTLVIFLCLSVLFYIYSLKFNRILFLFLSGLMISLGFLTKGFVTFTPLAFPFFIWIFLWERKFFPMVLDTALILISSLVPLLLLFIFTGAHDFLPKYIEMATTKIITGETANSRFYIIYRLGMELIPAIVILLTLFIYYRKSDPASKIVSINLRPALTFFSLGMAGVLPILLTMDQSGYFLLTSFPFFAISLGLLVNPLIEIMLGKIDYNSNGYRLFKIFGVMALSAGIILSVYFSGDFNRDKNKLTDMRVILNKLEGGITISILPEMYEDWPLHCYYARYKNVSLDAELKNRHEYLLIRASLYSDTLKKRFDKIDLKTKEYDLFRRKTEDTKE